MVGNLKQARTFVGALAATTCCIAVGAVMGVVPRVGEPNRVSITAVAAQEAAMDREPQLDAAVPEAPRAVEATVAPPPSPTTVAPAVTVAPGPRPDIEPASAPTVPKPAVADTAAPAVALAAPARRIPSPAEIQQAIRGMEGFITFKSGLFGLVADAPTPSAAQVDQLGDLVCTALDEGQTVEQAKATGLQMAADNPWVTISSAGADYVVRTAVALYCPGHADKLV